jgi:flagellar L-ring protein precursor FlgH
MSLTTTLKAGLILASVLATSNAAYADSLYSAKGFQSLTSDVRLRRIGDLITVMVYETATASSSANTSASRDANVGIGAGIQQRAYSGSISTNNRSDGGGRTIREGKVLAQITVAVRDITPSGDLIVSGEQMLDINNERQQISVEGRIRPQDVSETNIVLSTRIANARIRYAGQGDLSDKQRPAWWQRLLTLFGA